MVSTKPRLFILGDSFAQWPKPDKQFRWPVLMEEHYEVHNFAIPGTDNSHIIYQLGQIPEFRQGDRLVIILTEVSRIPKWFWGEYYEQYLEARLKPSMICKPKQPELQFVKGLVDLKLYLIELIEKTDFINTDIFKRYRHRKTDHPLMVFEMYSNIPTLFKQYKPLMVTWSKETYNVLPNHVKLIGWDEYEHIHVPEDDHPSISGNKVWYDKIYKWLQNDFIQIPSDLKLNKDVPFSQKNNT
jgi:hypothetical protein